MEWQAVAASPSPLREIISIWNSTDRVDWTRTKFSCFEALLEIAYETDSSLLSVRNCRIRSLVTLHIFRSKVQLWSSRLMARIGKLE